MEPRILLIQLHPQRVPTLNLEQARAAFAKLAQHPLVRGSRVTEGEEEGPYLNFEYKTDDLAALWDEVKSSIYDGSLLAFQLQRASMAIAQGDEGWDDYLVLHHFDPAIEPDEFV
ncbi:MULTISPECIES: hypothetical protein [Chitinibacter]|uniref:hypothetical protein n=1 Tax=Chitinibacter TaxID=230666 RepID=UPI000403E1FF|nr:MULTISPECIES: hypothetical protein [Chitinibacter]